MIITTVLLAVCGGLGAAARLVMDAQIRRHESRFPAGTMIINVIGSLLLGLVTGLVSAGLPTKMQDIAGTGFLGGYTTFSTACLEVVRLARDRRIGAAIGHATVMLVLGTAAAAGGWSVGRLF